MRGARIRSTLPLERKRMKEMSVEEIEEMEVEVDPKDKVLK